MRATGTKPKRPAHPTRRERAELQSMAARARQDRTSRLAHLAAFLRGHDARGRELEEPARWRPYAALGLAVVGLGISSYLTAAHFSGAALVCSDTGVVNCEKVTTSAQSYFLGVPVALWGLLFYAATTAVNLPAAWRSPDRRLHVLRLVMAVGGMCFVLYLVSAEMLIIKNICLWCTGVHVVTFLLFVLVTTTVPRMLGWGGVQPEPAGPGRGSTS